MSAFVAHTLRDVPSSEAMAQLGADARALGQSVWETMDAVNTQWKLIEGAFVLVPYGTPSEALGAPLVSTSIFADVMSQARDVLVHAADDVFAPFEQTRADLQGTIENLNGRHLGYSAELQREVSTFQSDPDNDPTITGRNHPDTDAYANAKVNLGLLDQEAERLALDVEMFHRALAQAEQDLAAQLRRLSGGDTINRFDGSTVTTSQTAWGLFPPGLPTGPGYAPPVVSLNDYLELAIARSAADRIHWLTTAGDQAVTDWLAAHPEFFAAIGFIPPAQSAALYDQLASMSTADESGAWIAGPLATLWNRAPGAIGNLNGLKTSVRAPFAEREVKRLLADPTLSEDAKTKLRLLDREVIDGVRVLSVFIDDTGSPRASLMLGDPDTADQVVTITHGIATDLGQLEEWSTILRDVHSRTAEQIRARHLDSSTAVILQMEWDSGEWNTVWREDLPAEGAEREAALVEGIRHVNSTARQEGWAHSLGTTATMIAQMHEPGLFDHVTLFGSAGLTPEANAAMEDAIAEGDITVSVTGAEADWIALHGRPPVLSTHAIDPASSEGVGVFGSNGGPVEDYLTPDGKPIIGLPTGGHNAGASDEFIYRIHRAPGWTPGAYFGSGLGIIAPLVTIPEDSVGYMDPRGQSFLQAIADFAERVEARQ